LIRRFEKKIQATITRVWGDDEPGHDNQEIPDSRGLTRVEMPAH
jgi:hypothetical protein